MYVHFIKRSAQASCILGLLLPHNKARKQFLISFLFIFHMPVCPGTSKVVTCLCGVIKCKNPYLNSYFCLLSTHCSHHHLLLPFFPICKAHAIPCGVSMKRH